MANTELDELSGLLKENSKYIPTFKNLNKIVKPDQSFLENLTNNDYDSGYSIPDNNAQEFYQDIRLQNQPGTHQAFNAITGGLISGAATAVEDISYLPNIVTQFIDNDYETNAIAETIQNFKQALGEELPIYRSGKGTWSWDDGAIVWDSLKGILDSAVGFGLPGIGIAGTVSKGVSRASKLFKILEGSKALQSAITSVGSGLIMNDLEGTMMGVELYENLIAQGVDKETAAQKATEFKRLNRLFAITDALQVHGLFKGVLPGGTRNTLNPRGIIANLGKLNEENLLVQGVKEGVEEIGQNVIQGEKEYEGLIDSGKKDAANKISSETNMFNRVLDLATSEKALYEGMLGFLGGGPQRVMSDLIAGNYGKAGEEQDKVYNEQQELIKQTNEGLAQSLNEFVKTQKLTSELASKGEDAQVQAIKDSQFNQLMLKNFQAGTTENLQNQLEDVVNLSEEKAQERGLSNTYKQDAEKALNELKKSEKQWNKLISYNNKEEVFYNIKKGELLNKQYSFAQNKLQESLNEVNNQGSRIAQREIEKSIKDAGLPATINLGINYDINNLENPYENPVQKKAYNQTVNYLKKTKAFKDYMEAKDNLNTVQDKLAANDEEYSTITSDTYQKTNGFVKKVKQFQEEVTKQEINKIENEVTEKPKSFTSKAEFDDFKANIASNELLSDEDKARLQKSIESAYTKEFNKQKDEAKGIKDLDEKYKNRPLLLDNHLEQFSLKYGIPVTNLEDLKTEIAKLNKEETFEPLTQDKKAEVVNTKVKVEEPEETKFESNSNNVNAVIHDVALVKFKKIEQDEKGNILDSSRVEVSGLKITESLSYGDFKKKYQISEDTRDISLGKYYTLKDKQGNVVKSTQNNVGVDLNYLRDGKLKEGDVIHYEVDSEINSNLPKNYQNAENFSVLLVKYDNENRIIVGQLPAYKEGDNAKLLSLRNKIYEDSKTTTGIYKYSTTNKVKDVFSGKFWNTSTINHLDSVLKEGEPLIIGVALNNEANQITLASGTIHTDDFGIETRELKAPDGESIYTHQEGTRLTPGVTYQIFKALNGKYIPYRVFTSKVKEISGFKQEILELLNSIKSKEDYQRVKPIIDNWYVAKSKGFDFTWSDDSGNRKAGFNFKPEDSDNLQTELTAEELYESAKFDDRYAPVIVYDGTTPYLGAKVTNPKGEVIDYNEYIVSKGIVKTDVNPIQHFHSPKFNLDLDSNVKPIEIKSFDVKPKAETPQVQFKFENATNPFAEQVKENPMFDIEAKKADIEKLQNKLFNKTISENDWNSETHGDFVKYLGLIGENEQRDTIRNIPPKDSRVLYLAHSLRFQKNGNVQAEILLKKADIERRRQEELNRVDKQSGERLDSKDAELRNKREAATRVLNGKDSKSYLESEQAQQDYDILGGNIYGGIVSGSLDSGYIKRAFTPHSEEVNAKYDAELAALETKPIEEKKKFKKIPNKFTEDKPKERREVKLVKTWNKEQELTWFKEKYPNVPITVLDDLRKIHKSGKNAWGMFYNSAVFIKQNAGEGTTYHEAFHVAFNMLLDEKQQQELIKEAKEKFNLNDKTDLEVEEFLADKFMDRVLTNLTPKSFGAKILNFFKRLWDTIKFSINNKNTLDNFFYKAEKGEKAFPKFKRDVSKFTPKYRVDGLTPNEEYQAITTFRNFIITTIQQEREKKQYSKLSDKQFYKKIFDKNNLEENVVITAYNDFITDFFDEEGNLDSEYEGEIGDKITTILSNIYDSENDKLGPLYDEVVRSFRMLGIKVNYTYDTASEEQDINEEQSKEGWQTNVSQENPQDSLSDRLKLWLSSIPNITKWLGDNKYETKKNIFGYPETLGETQAYNYLLQNLANSTSAEEVKNKLINLAKSTEWVNKVLYDVENNDKYLTDLYLMSQLNDTTFVFLSQKPNGQYLVSDANSQAIVKRIVSDWNNNFNSPLNKLFKDGTDEIDIKKAEETSRILDSLTKLLSTESQYVNKLERILDNTGITVPSSVLEQLIKNPAQYKAFMTNLNALFNIIKQGKSPFVSEEYNQENEEVEKDKTSNYILNNLGTILKRVYPHYYQASHTNVEGNKVFNHIKASFMSRFFSRMSNKDASIRKPFLENYKDSVFFNKSPLINDLLDDSNNLYQKLKFTLFDGTKRMGDDSGKKYDKLSESQLNSTLINLYFNNRNKDRAFYGYPVLADTGNLVLIEHKKYTPEAALEALYQTSLQEWDRINSKRPDIKNYNKNGANFVIFDFLNKSKNLFELGETSKDKIKALIQAELDKSVDNYKKFLVSSNVLSKDDKGVLTIKDKSLDNRINPNTYLTEFVYADTLMQIQLGTLLSGDPAFYKSTDKGGVEDFYKRNKQVWAPKTYLDVTKMDSPTYRVKILQDVEDSEVSKELVKKIKENLEKAGMSSEVIKEIMSNYDGVNETDAQAYIDIERYKQIEKGRNRWTDKQEAAYQRIIKNEAYNSDFVILQPFKPFVFTHLKIDNTIVPLQLKNSELLLTPQYAEGSEKLMKLMTDMGYTFKDGKYVGYNPNNRKVDSIMFQSAVKAGEHKTTTWDKIDEAQSITVANEDYGIQQETPIHHLDDENLFGTQIRKLIVGDLDRKAIYTTPNGESMSGQQLLDKFNNLISTDLELVYKDLQKELSKDNFDKLVDKVRQEILDRGMESKYIEALESTPDGKTVLPLWHPLVSYKVETLLNSVVKNAGTKVKFNGGSFYNASAFGFEDDLDIKFNKDGSLDYFEVKMPAWSEDIVKLLSDKDGFINPDSLAEAGLDTGIVYRIPTENKYSMFRIKVVGFTPDVAGGHIIMPTLVTKIAGLDFDIDKVYAMLYNHRVVDGKIVKVPSNEDSKQGRQNQLLDLMQAVLTNKNTLKQQLTPGGFNTLTNLKNEFKQYTSKGNLNFFSPQTRTEIFTRNMTGSDLIGIFANFNSCHQLYENANVKLKFTEENAIKFDGKVKRSLSDKKDTTEGHRNITDNIAEFLAAAVDNAKDPIASYLNLNTYTADVVGMIVSVGYPIETAIAFVNQPIIRKFVEVYFNEKGRLSDTAALNQVLSDFKSKVKDQIPENQIAVGAKWEFTTEWLKDQIKFNKLTENRGNDFYLKQLQVLRTFESYKKQSKSLSDLIRATKVADSGAGPSFADTVSKIRLIKKVTSPTFADNIEGVKEFFSEKSPLTALNKYFIEATTNEFFNDDRITYLFNPAVQDLIDDIEDLKEFDLTSDEIKHVQEHLISFLASGFDKYNHEESKSILTKTPEKLRNYKHDQKGKSKFEPFLAYLKVENNNDILTKKEVPLMIYFDGLLGGDTYLQEVMRNTWEEMLKTGDNEERKLAEDLLRYTFYSNGFSFGANTFYHIAPVSYFSNLKDNNDKTFNDFLQNRIDDTKLTIQEGNDYLKNFTEQYIRNNFSKLSFIKKVKTDDNNKNITTINLKNDKPNEILLNEDAMQTSNLVRKIGKLKKPDEYIKYYNEKDKKNYLFKLKESSSEGAIYQRIPTLGYKKRGIGALEYDLNNSILESKFSFNDSWKSENNVVSLPKIKIEPTTNPFNNMNMDDFNGESNTEFC